MSTQRTNQIAQTVGRNLRAARQAREMTQRQVGEQVGVEGKDVSRWESGKVEPGPNYRFLLADLLFDGSVSALYAEPEEIAA